jgi:hypothetical protein
LLPTCISPNLDINFFQAYTVFMRQFTTLLFIVMFLVAGSVSVPYCYVLQPDCPERGTFACPYATSSGQIVAESGSSDCCSMARVEGTQKQKKALPSGMMTQFKIEKDRHIDSLNIEAPGESLLQKVYSPPSHKTFSSPSVFSRRLAHFHPPPLTIILQKQSFLI